MTPGQFAAGLILSLGRGKQGRRLRVMTQLHAQGGGTSGACSTYIHEQIGCHLLSSKTHRTL